jgi:hypothetical protein
MYSLLNEREGVVVVYFGVSDVTLSYLCKIPK